MLPFDNMSDDPSVDSIVDGIVEEITATLSRVRDFTVIARNSAYAYKGRPVDVRTIARDLGVRYVLEGSLRKAGDRVRVTAQLIDATTGNHLWADRYDGVVENLFDFEDEIASRVAGALRPSIWDAEIALARRKRPENMAAYDLVLRAMPHLWAHRRDDNAEAIRLLDQAMGLDPFYARATAIGAWARAQHVVYNWTDDIETLRAEGERLIERGLAVGRRRPDGALRPVDGDDAPLRRPRPCHALRRAGAGARPEQCVGVDPARLPARLSRQSGRGAAELREGADALARSIRSASTASSAWVSPSSPPAIRGGRAMGAARHPREGRHDLGLSRPRRLQRRRRQYRGGAGGARQVRGVRART